MEAAGNLEAQEMMLKCCLSVHLTWKDRGTGWLSRSCEQIPFCEIRCCNCFF